MGDRSHIRVIIDGCTSCVGVLALYGLCFFFPHYPTPSQPLPVSHHPWSALSMCLKSWASAPHRFSRALYSLDT